MKLHLDFSELTNLAKLMMPEGINFSLNTYTSMFLLNDIELAFDKDINFIEFDNHDEHKVLIGQYLSDIASISYFLTEREMSILGKYGAWMEALADGRILPFTPEQKRFILVGEGKLDAHTEFEKIWQHVIKIREETIKCISPL